MTARRSSVAIARIVAADRAEQEAQFKRRYGELLPDVLLLQKRGFVVDKVNGGIRVGNMIKTPDEVRAMADRERRLAGDSGSLRRVTHTVSGLRVGQVVPTAAADRGLRDKARRAASGGTPLSAMKQKLSGAALLAKQKAEKVSQELGPEPRLDWIATDRLTIDRRYQREMGKGNWAHVNRILREWNWLYYQPIVVTPAAAQGKETGDGYVVIDGQHRLEAARKHPNIDRLPCYIVDASDVALQARAFVELNARRIGVTRLQRFWAAHAAGEPTALRIHKVCSDAGVAIARSAGVLPPKTSYATFTIEKLLPRGDGLVRTALQVLAETHGDKHDAFRSPIIFALAQLVASKDFDRARLVATLRGLELDKLMGEARSWRAQNRGALEKAVERELRLRYESQRLAT